ncbi:hypothetical protein GQ53DRAFT_652784 [Thozetella sp. PMI_491]|nr:hypothetical protein GQ53DRAFT_652784 [Thozetella sp. PMI_491]
MSPRDPDLVPNEQNPRFDGDLYTAKWVRGNESKQEGWCGICKPGRWFLLKTAEFWYHRCFTHGISPSSGKPFNEPIEFRRIDGKSNLWEALCDNCDDWIKIVVSKKKGSTWFRHAYKVIIFPCNLSRLVLLW